MFCSQGNASFTWEGFGRDGWRWRWCVAINSIFPVCPWSSTCKILRIHFAQFTDFFLEADIHSCVCGSAIEVCVRSHSRGCDGLKLIPTRGRSNWVWESGLKNKQRPCPSISTLLQVRPVKPLIVSRCLCLSVCIRLAITVSMWYVHFCVYLYVWILSLSQCALPYFQIKSTSYVGRETQKQNKSNQELKLDY